MFNVLGEAIQKVWLNCQKRIRIQRSISKEALIRPVGFEFQRTCDYDFFVAISEITTSLISNSCRLKKQKKLENFRICAYFRFVFTHVLSFHAKGGCSAAFWGLADVPC